MLDTSLDRRYRMTVVSTWTVGSIVAVALVATIIIVMRVTRPRGKLGIQHVKWQQRWDEWKEANEDWYTPFVVLPVLFFGLLVYVTFWLPIGSWVYFRMRSEQCRKN